MFGASAYLARTLVDTPELIDLLLELGLTPPTRSIAQIAADLEMRLRAVGLLDPEEPWSAIAEVKNGHVLRVSISSRGDLVFSTVERSSSASSVGSTTSEPRTYVSSVRNRLRTAHRVTSVPI